MRLARAVSIAVVVVGMCAAPFVACAQTSAVTQPGNAAGTIADTPEVKRLKELLAVVNTGDAAALRAYLETNTLSLRTMQPWPPSELQMVLEYYRVSLGLDLVRVTTIGPQQFQPQRRGTTVGILRNRTTGDEQTLAIMVEPQAPHRITGLPILHPGLIATLVQRRAPVSFSETAQLQEIEVYLKRVADADIFSGVVLIARDGQPVFSQAYGYADRENRIANTLSTPFLLGSMNKLFTGLAIGQLVEQGKLSYDDPLSKFVPDFPDRESARRIRIKHLLSHTSGLVYSNRNDDESLDRMHTVQAMIDAADREPLGSEPGTKWDYNNTGFVLLGRIIEKVTGEDYYDYMLRNVFAPAGMATASFPMLPRNGVATVPMAYPYEVEFNGERLHLVNKLGAQFRRGGPSCCAIASALDLVALANALPTGRVVQPETFRLHSSAKPELGAPTYGYGFAVGMRRANNRLLVGHGGNAAGQCTEFGALKDTPYTIIVLSNLTIGTCVSVAGKIMRVLTPPQAPTG